MKCERGNKGLKTIRIFRCPQWSLLARMMVNSSSSITDVRDSYFSAPLDFLYPFFMCQVVEYAQLLTW